MIHGVQSRNPIGGSVGQHLLNKVQSRSIEGRHELAQWLWFPFRKIFVEVSKVGNLWPHLRKRGEISMSSTKEISLSFELLIIGIDSSPLYSLPLTKYKQLRNVIILMVYGNDNSRYHFENHRINFPQIPIQYPRL